MLWFVFEYDFKNLDVIEITGKRTFTKCVQDLDSAFFKCYFDPLQIKKLFLGYLHKLARALTMKCPINVVRYGEMRVSYKTIFYTNLFMEFWFDQIWQSNLMLEIRIFEIRMNSTYFVQAYNLNLTILI